MTADEAVKRIEKNQVFSILYLLKEAFRKNGTWDPGPLKWGPEPGTLKVKPVTRDPKFFKWDSGPLKWDVNE